MLEAFQITWFILSIGGMITSVVFGVGCFNQGENKWGGWSVVAFLVFLHLTVYLGSTPALQSSTGG